MKIYIPYYDRCNWHIQEADAEQSRQIGRDKSWLYRGMIFGSNAYTDEQGAQNYIDKKYNDARKTEYKEASNEAHL